MKKIILTFLVLVFNFGLNAQVIVQYDFENPKIKDLGDYQLVNFDKTTLLGRIGEPVLPYMPVKILLPPNCEIDSFKIIYENKTKISRKIKLYPKQPVRPISWGKDNIFHINTEVYNSKKYPQNKNTNLKTSFLNGFSIALGRFTPVEYNPKSSELFYYKKVRIIIYYSTSKANILKNLNTKNPVLQRISNFVQNPVLLKSYPQKNYKSGNYDILIITGQEFVNSFDFLANIFIKMGLKTNIVSTDYISSSQNGQDLQEKIRNYIIDQYQNFGIQYVLLGGDVSVVPERGFYCSVNSPHGSTEYITDDHIPADLYYSALDGTWNDDQDSYWGEPGEDDLLPEISVGRLPFQTNTELQAMLHKIYMFTLNPVENELNKSILAGEYLYDDPETWGGDYLDLLIGYHEDNGYTTNGIPENFPYHKLYDKFGSWSSSDLLNLINSGYPLLHHVGHASTDNMMKLSLWDITNDNFSGANGTDHNFVIVYSHGCYCGQYDADDCIAEESMKIDNFAVAELVNSRYGWFDEGFTEGPSEHLHREYVDALYNDKEYHLGTAEVISKIETAPFVNQQNEWEPGAQRWVFYDHNVLGVPMMPVWTDIPYDINVNFPVSVPLDGFTVTVQTQNGIPIENAVCVVIQNNEIIAKQYTDQNGIANLVFNNAQYGQAKLYVSGYNILIHEYGIVITDLQNAYVDISSLIYEDEDNNEPNYNETLHLNLCLKNYGGQTANNVAVVLTPANNSDNYTITTNQISLGDINAGDTVSNSDITLRIYYPENSVTDTFWLDINFDKKQTVRKTLLLKYKTPAFSLESISLSELSGNNNGYPEPGETIKALFVVKNSGDYNSTQGIANFSTDNQYITIQNNQIQFKALNKNDTAHLNVIFSVSDQLPDSLNIDLNCVLQTQGYGANISAVFPAGEIFEDFETGDFSKFDWQTSGDMPWEIVSNVVHTGNYASASGNITHNQSSELSITLNISSDGKIKFYRKVSSEEDFDFLKFYIDNSLQEAYSGEQNWQQEQFNVNAGIHTFKWSYQKDGSVSDGSDKAWIDDITFPLIADISIDNITHADTNFEITADKSIKVYPNPFDKNLFFELYSTENQNITIEIYDLNGRKILKSSAKIIKGKNVIALQMQGLNAGMYVYQIKGKNFMRNGIILKK